MTKKVEAAGWREKAIAFLKWLASAIGIALAVLGGSQLVGCASPNKAYVDANVKNVAHVKAAHLPTVPASQREDWQDFYESWELLNREAGK